MVSQWSLVMVPGSEALGPTRVTDRLCPLGLGKHQGWGGGMRHSSTLDSSPTVAEGKQSLTF